MDALGGFSQVRSVQLVSTMMVSRPLNARQCCNVTASEERKWVGVGKGDIWDGDALRAFSLMHSVWLFTCNDPFPALSESSQWFRGGEGMGQGSCERRVLKSL